MCGFFGEYTNQILAEIEFKELLDKSINRGPDQQNIWKDQHFQVGFNRLSILDVSENGIQPIVSPNSRFIFVFNGEIYNFKELQKQYQIPDSKLRSKSDSEIIAHLLEIFPPHEIPGKLNGMFAIAIYDQKESELFLFRDFSGIKPLFYGTSANGVVFGSQFDQIFLHPSIKNNLEIDPDGLFNYVALGYMAGSGTIFKNINQCNPGEWIRFKNGTAIQKGIFQSWPKKCTGTLSESSDAALIELDKLLNEVVSDQLVSDVPLGVFLSGGIDSPLISYFAKKHKTDLTAYTISVDDPKLDESDRASQYAKDFNLKHKIIHFNEKELVDQVENHFHAFSEPFGDFSSLPTYMVTKIARQDNTVMLSGDGGDELFWGYPRFLNTLNNANWFKFPLKIRKYPSAILRRLGLNISDAVSFLERIDQWVLEQQSYSKIPNVKRYLPHLYFSKDINDLYQYNFDTKVELMHYLKWNEFYGHLQRVLIKVDRCSMENQMEVRVPFLDKRIVDFSWKLKPGLGITHHEPKFLLKKLLKAKLIKSSIDNGKKGFSVPIEKWMKGPLKEDIYYHLTTMPMFGADYWDSEKLRNDLNDFMEGKNKQAWGIWIVYCLQKWAAKYNLIH